jgi:hypothetical protein
MNIHSTVMKHIGNEDLIFYNEYNKENFSKPPTFKKSMKNKQEKT